jgi:hypothetical protein
MHRLAGGRKSDWSGGRLNYLVILRQLSLPMKLRIRRAKSARLALAGMSLLTHLYRKDE